MPTTGPVRRYRGLLYAAAVLFAVATTLYSAAWMYYVRRPLQTTQVEIGIDAFYSSAGVEIDDVHPNSPAEKAGLKVKDLIVAINGSSADSESAWNGLENRTWLRSQPGDTVTLTVRRPGQSQPLVITPWFRAKQGAGDTRSRPHGSGAGAGLISSLVPYRGIGGPVSTHGRWQRMGAGAGVCGPHHRRSHAK